MGLFGGQLSVLLSLREGRITGLLREENFIELTSLLQNYKNAVTPAEAGVQKPLTSLDSCFRRNDRKKQA